MSSAIIGLRKVRGVSGLTAVLLNVGCSIVGNISLTFGRGAAFVGVPFTGFLMSFGLVILAMALLALMLAHPLAAHPIRDHSVMLLMSGSLTAKLKEKNDQLAAKNAELHGIFEAGGADFDFNKPEVLKAAGASNSAEVVEKVKAKNKELEDLGKEHDDLAEFVAIEERVKRARTAPNSQPPFPDNNKGGGERRVKTLGELITESAVFKAFQKSKAPNSATLEGDEAKSFGMAELKANFTTAAGWAPESTRTGLVVEKATRPLQVLDIIPTGTTEQAAVVFMEETTRTHAAAERAEAAAYAESAFALTQRSETVRAIGDSVPVTDEQLMDVGQSRSYLDQRLGYGVRQRLDGQIINADGNAPNLTGILNKAGIQTQARGADSIPDAFYKAMVKVRVTGRAVPTACILNPTDWQGVRLLKTADGIYIWGSPSEAGPMRLWGATAIEADVIAQGTGLTGDFVNFIQLFERSGIEVEVGYINDQFTKGLRTIRAGMRVALAIYRAAAFCTVTGL